jgi:hypothetical protein
LAKQALRDQLVSNGMRLANTTRDGLSNTVLFHYVVQAPFEVRLRHGHLVMFGFDRRVCLVVA